MHMNRKFSRKFWVLTATSALALLVACGSGGGGTASLSSLATSLTSALNAMSANMGNYASFVDLLDPNFKQDGLSKADLSAVLAADAAALPGEASFPNITYSDATISNCNAAQVCDLNVTVTNKDADTVSTTMVLKVVLTSSGYKLIGDQSAS
jgi:hypothetical protein